MEIENLVYFFPARITGGAQYLFVRQVNYLLSHDCPYKIHYIEYPDGFARKQIVSDNIVFIDFDDDIIPRIPDNSVIITQLNYILKSNVFKYNSSNSVIIYFFLHTLNIRPSFIYKNFYFLSRKELKDLGKEISWLSYNNIIKYLAYGAYFKMAKDLKIKPDRLQWIPNIAPVKDHKKPLISSLNKKMIRFCWLGRLDEEKSRNIITYMNELETLPQVRNVSLSIIGLGPKEEFLRYVSRNYSFPVSFIGELRDAALDRFIFENVDIGLASGTSAYELALRGKPVIIDGVLDKIYQAGKRASYMYTHEEQNYDYSFFDRLKRKNESNFKVKFENLLNNYCNIASADYEYVVTKSAANSCKQLLYTIEEISKNAPEVYISHVQKAKEILSVGERRIGRLVSLKKLFFL